MTVAQKADFTPSSRENEIETRIRALDELLLSTHTMASRGGAIGSKPNREWREFVKKWKVFEGKREDTAEEAETQSGDWTRDDDETTVAVNSTQPRKTRAAPRVTRSGTYRRRPRSSWPR